METEQVKELILSGLPDAQVEVIDTTGTKDHFSAVVVSEDFIGKSMVQQHQMVYRTLGKYLTNEIHALQLKTITPEQWKENN